MKDCIIKYNVLKSYKGLEKHVIIPNSVTSIGEGAFEGCSGLTEVTIPNSVTSIGDHAFCLVKNIFYSGSAEGSPWGALNVNAIPDENGFIYSDAEKTKLTAYVGEEKEVTIPNSVTSIGDWAFNGCSGLTSVIVSDSITSVGEWAFGYCGIKQSPPKNIAYKGFYKDMTCRAFQYEEGKTYTCDEAKLCKYGFHACLNPLDCFNYYFGKDVVYHEVILEERTNEKQFDSKICGKKITIGRRLTIKEMFDIFNELNK